MFELDGWVTESTRAGGAWQANENACACALLWAAVSTRRRKGGQLYMNATFRAAQGGRHESWRWTRTGTWDVCRRGSAIV